MNHLTLVALQVAASFVPQPDSRVPSLTEYAVILCASSPTVLSGGRIYEAAATRIRPVPRAPAQAILSKRRSSSAWRWLLSGSRLVGILATSLLASGSIKLRKEQVKLKAAVPLTTATLEAVRIVAEEKQPPQTLPADLLPPRLHLSPDSCEIYSILAAPMPDPPSFSVEIPMAP